MSTNTFCVKSLVGHSAVRVIRRHTNVHRKEGNQLVSNKEQCSVPDVLNVLGAREEGLSVYRCVPDSR